MKATLSNPLQRLTFGLILLTSLIGGALVVYTTRWGPWAYSDSVGCMEVANNIAIGRGPVQIKGSGRIMLQTLKPPFYSVVISFFGADGAQLNNAARWMDVVLFAGPIA